MTLATPQPPDLLDYTAGQVRRGQLILFTGAGFSHGAKNPQGLPLPTADELKEVLWRVCYSGPLDVTTGLQELFELARIQHRRALKDVLLDRLTVDAESLPDHYRLWFSMPWYRVYTLNIDDLASAVARQFTLPRQVRQISATAAGFQAPSRESGPVLEVVHLNGTLDDLPDGVTFSVTQYAERLARQEPWYAQCAADLVTHPVIFVGTRLDEPPLWQHIEMRRGRGNQQGLRELRRKSYLVSQTIDAPRRELLQREFNVVHLPMTADEFASQVLGNLEFAASEGLRVVSASRRRGEGRDNAIPEVSVLAASEPPSTPTEFLVGAEPRWADLHAGRAIPRSIDTDIITAAKGLLSREGEKGILLVTGTAGSGKSTSLMRLGLTLAAEGRKVGWIDRDVELGPRDIKRLMANEEHPEVLIIDDADLYGSEIAVIAEEVCCGRDHPVVVLGTRSSRADRIGDRLERTKVSFVERSMPPLTDSDIGQLLDVLAREHRLGILKGMTRAQQEERFRQEAGRQLLIALLDATSDRRFEERIIDEMADLDTDSRGVYALVAAATALRFDLQRDEILLAVQEGSNATLNTIDNLVRRNLLITRRTGGLAVRHWLIGSTILDHLATEGSATGALGRLAFAAGSKVSPGTPRGSRSWRRLKALINHDFLLRIVRRDAAADIYQSLEELLHWDYHYWLQRGSLELEGGDLRLAQNFLSQAYSMAPSDYVVQTEYAYLRIRLAVDSPTSTEAPGLVQEGFDLLEGVIEERGEIDAYPYHVLGSQGLAWSRRASLARSARKDLLEALVERVGEGVENHPRIEELQRLHRDLKAELLGLAVEHR